MKGFLDLPYRSPFVEHYRDFDRGFYVDFHRQLEIMGRWLLDHGCRRTLDIGAMTGGCIEHISALGIRMDGVQFTQDIRRLAAARLRRAGIRSSLWVSPVHAPPRIGGRGGYDGAVSLGWFNLPFSRGQLKTHLARLRSLLRPGGILLFDFFGFRELVVPPTEAVDLGGGLAFVAHAERIGRTLRRHHLWIRDHVPVGAEYADLVDRTPAEARRLLAESGFEVVRTKRLALNYPREFWAAVRS